MKKLVLIGGGDIGRGNTSYETKEIESRKYIKNWDVSVHI